MQGPIYQAIDCKQSSLDNIVELEPPPTLPQPVGEPLSVRASLHHTFTVSEPDTVRIIYDSTSAELLSGGCASHPSLSCHVILWSSLSPTRSLISAMHVCTACHISTRYLQCLASPCRHHQSSLPSTAATALCWSDPWHHAWGCMVPSMCKATTRLLHQAPCGDSGISTHSRISPPAPQPHAAYAAHMRVEVRMLPPRCGHQVVCIACAPTTAAHPWLT